MNAQNCDDAEFSDERFLTASEKRLILNSLKVFLKHGCQLSHFTERLYNHLILHCSFIAHYNLRGFYSVYFDPGSRRTQKFFDQFDPAKPGESAEGMDGFWLNHPTGADLNRAMRESAAPYIARLRFQFSETERENDLAIATGLAAKWGKQLTDRPQGVSAPPEVRIEASQAPDQLAMSFGAD
jgi:hypothetical protein